MIFKRVGFTSLVIGLLAPALVWGADLSVVKKNVIQEYNKKASECITVSGIDFPDDLVGFINGCKGEVTTSVRERPYNIASLEVAASCIDFEGDSIRSSARVTGIADIVTSKRKLKSSTVLDSSMMEMKKVDLSSVDGGVLCILPSNYSYTLKRNINAGDVIYEAFIRQSYAIKRSQMVNVIAKSTNGNGITVKTVAKATSNAYINDVVNVVSLSSHRYFKVRVTGYGKAQVM